MLCILLVGHFSLMGAAYSNAKRLGYMMHAMINDKKKGHNLKEAGYCISLASIKLNVSGFHLPHCIRTDASSAYSTQWLRDPSSMLNV